MIYVPKGMEIHPSPVQLSMAYLRATEKYSNLNHHLDPEGQEGQNTIKGALGEILFMDFYKHENPVDANSHHYDFLLHKLRVEVKSQSTLPYVADYVEQHCDWYFFWRITADLTRAICMGACSSAVPFAYGTFVDKGQPNPIFGGKPSLGSIWIVPEDMLVSYMKEE